MIGQLDGCNDSIISGESDNSENDYQCTNNLYISVNNDQLSGQTDDQLSCVSDYQHSAANNVQSSENMNNAIPVLQGVPQYKRCQSQPMQSRHGKTRNLRQPRNVRAIKRSNNTLQALDLPTVINLNPRSVYNKVDEFHSLVTE